MPVLSPSQDSTAREYPQHVVKHLSIAPVVALFSAQIDTANLLYDNQSGGFYGLKYTTSSGNASLCEVDMTVLIGTAVGKDDIARVRLRKPIDTAAKIVPISETPYGDLPLTSTCFLTVVNIFEPAIRLIRLVAIKTGNSQFENDFIEYHDYDELPTNHNVRIRPIVNIHSGSVSGHPLFPKLAGWALPNQNYRLLNLTADVVDLSNSAETFTYQWNIRDCVLEAGSLTSPNVTLRVPVGFRWVKVMVTNGGGRSQVKHIPLWTHDDTYLPLGENPLGFNVKSDSTDAGREMEFEVFAQHVTLDDVPKGALVCYWEEVLNEIPQHRTQFWGWVHSASYTLKEYGSMTVKVGGIASWMQKLTSFGTQVSNNPSPTKWFEIKNLNLERFIHYLLREYSTVLNFCNFYPDTTNRITRTETAARASLWEQCRKVCEAYQMRRFLADSNNRLWIRRHPSYLKNGTFNFPNERNFTPITTLTPDDLAADNPITFNEEMYKPLGRVDGTGDIWRAADPEPIVVASRAPSKTSGQGTGTEELPFQRLLGNDEAQAQRELNWLVGQHYARLNNRLKEVDVQLVGMFDVFEPAYTEIVRLSYQHAQTPTLTTESVDSLFVVTKVDVEHSAERGTARKKISLTLEEVTSGVPGVTVPIPKGQWVDNPMWDFMWKVNPAMPQFDFPQFERWNDVVVGFALAADRNNGIVGRTFNFQSNNPTWENVTPKFPPPPTNSTLYSMDGQFKNDTLKVKAVWCDTANAYIYGSNDALAASMSWTYEGSFPLVGSTFDEIAAIKADPEQNVWCFAWICRDGVRVRTSSGSGSWSAPIVVGSTSFISQPLPEKEIGLDISGGVIATTGKSAFGIWEIYTGSGLNPTFTPHSPSIESSSHWVTLKWGPEAELYGSSLNGVQNYYVNINQFVSPPTLSINSYIVGPLTTAVPYDTTIWYGSRYPFSELVKYQNTSVVCEGVFSSPVEVTKVYVLSTLYSFGFQRATWLDPAPSTGFYSISPMRIRYVFKVNTDRGVFSRNFEITYRAIHYGSYTYYSTFDYIYNPSTDISGNSSDIELNSGGSFRVYSYLMRATYLDPIPPIVLGNINILKYAAEPYQFYTLFADRVTHTITDPATNTAVMPSNVNFIASDAYTSSPWFIRRLYLSESGGRVPFARNGISPLMSSTGQMKMVGQSALDRGVEHREDYGLKLLSYTELDKVRHIKTAETIELVYGEDALLLKWRSNVYEPKLGNWLSLTNNNPPNFVDVVSLL